MCLKGSVEKKNPLSFHFSVMILSSLSSRTPAMIGCSFVVDREYFGEIGLLDPGMEVYGGENIELGMRVKSDLQHS